VIEERKIEFEQAPADDHRQRSKAVLQACAGLNIERCAENWRWQELPIGIRRLTGIVPSGTRRFP